MPPNENPNPIHPQKYAANTDVFLAEAPDFRVAFDIGFDSYFAFEAIGKFFLGEYVLGLLRSIFLETEDGVKSIDHLRVIGTLIGRV